MTDRRGRRGRAKSTTVSSPPPTLFGPQSVDRRDTDERYTPAWLFDELGVTFDVDVAAPPGGVPWIPARRFLTAADDALGVEWVGAVWCNPPFSQARAFAERFVSHGDGVGLFPLSQANWTGPLLEACHTLHVAINMKFESPTHAGRHTSFAVCVVGIGETGRAVRRLSPCWVRP